MGNNSSISCHQTGVIAGFMLLVLKLTSLPSLMYESNEVGGVVSITIMCLLNVFFLALLIWLKKRFANKSLFEIFKGVLGNIITRIIYLVLFVFFMFKLLSLVDDGFGFIRDIADDEFAYFNFLICFFPVICALAYSGIRNLARTCEFFYPFVLIGLFVAIVFSFAPIDFFGIGSISRINIGSIAKTLVDLSFWNGDLFAMLVFMDKIELKKGRISNIYFPIIIVSLFLVIAYTMYFSLYQRTSLLHTNMIFDIIEYTVGTSSGWHMDIFAIIIYMVCIFLQGGIYVYCASKTIERVFNFNNKNIIFSGIVVTLIIIQFLYLNDYLKYIVFATKYLSVFTLILLFAIPTLMFFVGIFKRREKCRQC